MADHFQCSAQGLGGELIDKPSAWLHLYLTFLHFTFTWLPRYVLGICSAILEYAIAGEEEAAGCFIKAVADHLVTQAKSFAFQFQ